jgi:hypothetical protein
VLSELGQVKAKLLWFIKSLVNLKQVFDPSPRILMGEQVHSKQNYKV